MPRVKNINELDLHYIIEPKLGCWIWQGTVGPKGYAQFSGKRVHIILFERHHGRKVKPGFELDHKLKPLGCPRNCVNPLHLEEVTHLENVLRSSNTKLTLEQVIILKSKLATHSDYKLSLEFNVSRQHIRKIRVGGSWGHV